MSAPTRVMLDIETLGLDIGAAIVSIGAVEFTHDRLKEEFSASVALDSCQDAGLSIDADTLEWWLEQDAGVREQLVVGDDLSRVLGAFTNWYRSLSPDEVWANAPSFDCEQLEHAGDAVGIEMPWAFDEERDVRTIANLPIAPDRDQDGTEHDPLDDARYQAHVVQETLQRLDTLESERAP